MYGVGPYEWICDTMNLYYGIVKSLNSIKPKIIPKSVRLWTLPLIQQHTREITENPIQWNNNHPKFNSGKFSSSYLPSLSSMFFICFHPFNFYQVSNCRSPVGSASTIASVFCEESQAMGNKNPPASRNPARLQQQSSWWSNQPIWKLCSSNGIMKPQVGMKITHIWNQHPMVVSPTWFLTKIRK